MIPRPVLDSVFIVVAALWMATALTIVLDRSRYDRRMRAWRTRRANDNGSQRHISASAFEEMVLAGLPPADEYALAQTVCARVGDLQLRMVADGSAGADIPNRVSALQAMVSARHRDSLYTLDLCLRSGDADLAGAAVRMLIRVDNRTALEILIAALCEGVYIPSRLAAAIDRMSVQRADLLGLLIEHVDPIPRFWGVRLAGRLRATEWAPHARELTADANPLVRRGAVETLGVIGEPNDRVLLMTRFLDPSPMVRLHAARAAATFGSPTVAGALAELLRDNHWVVRAAARDALRRMGEMGTAAATRTLWESDTFAANSAAEVLFGSGAALAISRRILVEPTDFGSRQTIERFLAVGGPHLERALLDQLDTQEASRLLSVVGTARDMGEAL